MGDCFRNGGIAVTPEREKIAARIRALRSKTVANGCTEEEAMSAAELLAKLLAQYNMTLDEAELRESPFERTSVKQDDWVGEKLWVVADGIAFLTGARYWSSRPGFVREVSFFGFKHEVEVARYLLELCARAMKPPAPTGKGLIVLHQQLIDTAMKDAGIELGEGGGAVDLAAFASHGAGVAAANRVAINSAIEKGPGADPRAFLK